MKSVKSYKTTKTTSTKAPSQLTRSQRKSALDNLANVVASKLSHAGSVMQPVASIDSFDSPSKYFPVVNSTAPSEDQYLAALACPGERPAPYVQNGRTTAGFDGTVRGVNDKLGAISKAYGLAVYAPIPGSTQASSGFYVTTGDAAVGISASASYTAGFVAAAIGAGDAKGYTAVEPPDECADMLTWANEISLSFEAAAATVAGSLYYKYVPWWSFMRGSSIDTGAITSTGVRIPLKPGHEYKFRVNVQQPWGLGIGTSTLSQELVLALAWHAPAYSVTTGSLAAYTPVFKFKSNWFGQPKDNAGWMSGGSNSSYVTPSKMPVAMKEKILQSHGINFSYKDGVVHADSNLWANHPPVPIHGLALPRFERMLAPTVIDDTLEESSNASKAS